MEKQREEERQRESALDGSSPPAAAGLGQAGVSHSDHSIVGDLGTSKQHGAWSERQKAEGWPRDGTQILPWC